MNRLRALAVPLLLVALAGMLAACSTTAAGPGSGSGSGSGAGSGGLAVDGAWARASDRIGGISAAYLTITNGGEAPDTLLRAASPVAETLEIHQTTSSGGMMGMRPVAGLEIAAGASVEFAPGGTHVMLIGLTEALRAGSSFPLVLTFERAGDVTVTAQVRGS